MKKIYFLLATFVLTAFVLTTPAPNQTNVKTSAVAPRSSVFSAAQLLNDVRALSADDMQGRSVGTAGGAKAREYVLKRFKDAGLASFENSYVQNFAVTSRSGEKLSGANVVGYVKGKRKPEKYIVVTAHYDHVGVRQGQVYNGADDNASGTAALFAMADYFRKKRPANSIIFVAFDAEEAGLQGSKHFVANLPVKKESIIVNVNMDMIARSDVNELYAVGTYAYPKLKPSLERVAKTAKIKLLFGHEGPGVAPSDDWTNQSDQGSFHKEKIPFIYFGVEDHKDYHQPTDDFANINQEFFVRAAETVLAAVKTFDKNLQ